MCDESHFSLCFQERVLFLPLSLNSLIITFLDTGFIQFALSSLGFLDILLYSCLSSHLDFFGDYLFSIIPLPFSLSSPLRHQQRIH